MSLHALYRRDEDSLDAEGLRMEAEDAEDRDLTDWEVILWAIEHGWEPVTRCDLCERPLPADAPLPLCSRCEDAARAHARLDAATREWEADGRPD